MRYFKYIVLALLLGGAVSFLHAGASCAAGKDLKVNLVISSDSFMIYAGAKDGIKVGDKFTIKRGTDVIGAAEVTRVEDTYSLAKVTQKSLEIRDMDSLVKTGSGAGAAPATTAPAAETAKKDEKKTETKPAAKAEEKKPAEKKAEAKPAAKAVEKKPAEKKAETPKKDDAAAAKKDDKKAAAKPAEPPKPSEPPSSSPFVSYNGPTGLFQMPTAIIPPKHTGGVSFFRVRNAASSMGSSNAGAITTVKDYSYFFTTKMERTALAFSYSVDDKMEISYAYSRVKADLDLNFADLFLTRTDGVHATIKQSVISIKYNPRQKFLLSNTTTKKFQYAVGLQRYTFSGGFSNNTVFYGAGTYPTPKVTAHATVYMVTGHGVNGEHWGTMFGLEAPLAKNISLISDADVYQGTHTYTGGIRYYIDRKTSVVLGVFDIAVDPSLMLNVAYDF